MLLVVNSTRSKLQLFYADVSIEFVYTHRKIFRKLFVLH